jgi:hypothetical protein
MQPSPLFTHDSVPFCYQVAFLATKKLPPSPWTLKDIKQSKAPRNFVLDSRPSSNATPWQLSAPSHVRGDKQNASPTSRTRTCYSFNTTQKMKKPSSQANLNPKPRAFPGKRLSTKSQNMFLVFQPWHSHTVSTEMLAQD